MSDVKPDRTVLYFFAVLLLPIIFIFGGIGLSYYGQANIAPPAHRLMLAYAGNYGRIDVRISPEGYAEARQKKHIGMDAPLYFIIVDVEKGIEKKISADQVSPHQNQTDFSVKKNYYTASELTQYVLKEDAPDGYVYQKSRRRGVDGILTIFSPDAGRKLGPYVRKGPKAISLEEWINGREGIAYPEFVGWIVEEK